MRRLFVDTLYWSALINRRDQWHERVLVASVAWRGVSLVTTEEVLSEFLTFVASFGPQTRATAANLVDEILRDPTIEVLPQSHASFTAGLALYQARPDKPYSLIDCVSMQRMRELGLTEALTYDQHFVQEVLVALLRDTPSR
jgi:predicted nucleic acid-binding protein